MKATFVATATKHRVWPTPDAMLLALDEARLRNRKRDTIAARTANRAATLRFSQ